MAAAQQVRDIGEGALREKAKRFGLDFQEGLAAEIHHLDMVVADKLIDGAVGRLRKHRAVSEIGHVSASAGRRG